MATAAAVLWRLSTAPCSDAVVGKVETSEFVPDPRDRNPWTGTGSLWGNGGESDEELKHFMWLIQVLHKMMLSAKPDRVGDETGDTGNSTHAKWRTDL